MDVKECSGVFSQNKPLKHLNRIVQTPGLDIAFHNLKYWARDSNVVDGWLQILNSLNGEFRRGELTAILGPSGAGKSTLLNVLSGFVTEKIDGTITINSLPKESKTFNKMTSFIMQENIIQPYLTVKESMTYAAGFKLGLDIRPDCRISMVEEVLNFLGLCDSVDTLSENLSGGQKRRLSIALELVGNPPVIFLDEPTTGLDDFNVKQCVNFLKKISDLGRTVVCTIHQPSPSILQVFDQLYILADGYCVYNGSPSQLLPFLADAGYECPSNYTPTDYVMELVRQDLTVVHTFKTLTLNGKFNLNMNDNKDAFNENNQDVCRKSGSMIIPVSYTNKLSILLSRMSLQIRRNRLGLCIQLLHHLFSGLLIGTLFIGVGNKANGMFAIFNFCVICIVYLMYTHTITPVLLRKVPLEMELLKREYFNRWYSAETYFSAWTLINLPLLIFFLMLFTTSAYYLSDQPQEIHRFVGFYLILLAVGLASQGLGFLLGVSLRATAGAFMGPLLMGLFLALGINRMGYEMVPEPFVEFILNLSFVRSSLIGLNCCLFYERGPLRCDDIECPYRRGDVTLTRYSIPITDYRYYLGYVSIFVMVFRIVGYVLLKCRLNVEFSSKVVYYYKKLLNVIYNWR